MFNKDVFKRFARDEEGGILIFVVMMFLTMVVAAGMAIDFMRHESARADLQNALDRGILAAVSVSQTLNDLETPEDSRLMSEAIVNDYMKSSGFTASAGKNLATVKACPGFEDDTYSSCLEASADYTMKTFFLNIIGYKTIKVPARARAEDVRKDVEISMVLDVSGSMGWVANGSPPDVDKITQLKAAAIGFVNYILEFDEEGDKTTISLIPYSQQVNLGQKLAGYYGLDKHHEHSYCADFDGGLDYSTVPIGVGTTAQFQHFWHSIFLSCPGANNQILAHSNDPIALGNAIEALSPVGYTATYVGMKWGAALLDPSARPVVTQLIADGSVSDVFAGIPRDYSEPRKIKVVILMTDGANTFLERVHDYRYDKYFDPTHDDFDPDHWKDNQVRGRDYYADIDNDETGEGDGYMYQMCDAFKANEDAVIYTIGFDLDAAAGAAEKLSYCASSLTKHFVVDGLSISDAFSEIASDINNLKLTN